MRPICAGHLAAPIPPAVWLKFSSDRDGIGSARSIQGRLQNGLTAKNAEIAKRQFDACDQGRAGTGGCRNHRRKGTCADGEDAVRTVENVTCAFSPYKDKAEGGFHEGLRCRNVRIVLEVETKIEDEDEDDSIMLRQVTQMPVVARPAYPATRRRHRHRAGIEARAASKNRCELHGPCSRIRIEAAWGD